MRARGGGGGRTGAVSVAGTMAELDRRIPPELASQRPTAACGPRGQSAAARLAAGGGASLAVCRRVLFGEECDWTAGLDGARCPPPLSLHVTAETPHTIDGAGGPALHVAAPPRCGAALLSPGGPESGEGGPEADTCRPASPGQQQQQQQRGHHAEHHRRDATRASQRRRAPPLPSGRRRARPAS